MSAIGDRLGLIRRCLRCARRLLRHPTRLDQVAEVDLVEIPPVRAWTRILDCFWVVLLLAVVPSLLSSSLPFGQIIQPVCAMAGIWWFHRSAHEAFAADRRWKQHLASVDSGSRQTYHTVVQHGILRDDDPALTALEISHDEAYIRCLALCQGDGPLAYDGKRFIACERLSRWTARRLGVKRPTDDIAQVAPGILSTAESG
jgi:hypothetical protein